MAATEIGNTNAYRGSAYSYGLIAAAQAALFNMVNDHGGVAGHKINFIPYYGGYSPPEIAEQTRRLIEQEQVVFLFNSLGTATNHAIERRVNLKRHRICSSRPVRRSGATASASREQWATSRATGPKRRSTPSTCWRRCPMPRWRSCIRTTTSARIIRRREGHPGRQIQGGQGTTHEMTDPSVDSQLTALLASGADVLLVGATPKSAAQAIRDVQDPGWHPKIIFMTNVSISIGSVMTPAGAENGVGIVTSG